MFVPMTENENIVGYAPAYSVKKSHFGERFYYWLGASGERYLHTVFPIDADFYSPGANLIIVRHEPKGERSVLFVGRVGQLSASEIDRLRLSQGANEQHIHLMAVGDAAIDKVAADVSQRHLTQDPTRRKPLPAVFFANVSF